MQIKPGAHGSVAGRGVSYDGKEGVGGTLLCGPSASKPGATGTLVYLDASPLLDAAVDSALAAGASLVLLDNMSLAQLQEAVQLNAGRAKLEVSGGVNLSTVRAIAATGVDRISIGALTKDVKAIDFSMRFAASPR